MEKEFIIVSRIDKKTPLDRHIPLHMTALPWFVSGLAPEHVVRELKVVGQSLRPVTTRATDEALFGPEQDIPVVRLERTPELLSLHLGLVALMRNVEGELDTRWVGADNWNPHVTHQPESRLHSGDIVQITDLDLITKRPDGMRELVARVELGGEHD